MPPQSLTLFVLNSLKPQSGLGAHKLRHRREKETEGERPCEGVLCRLAKFTNSNILWATVDLGSVHHAD